MVHQCSVGVLSGTLSSHWVTAEWSKYVSTACLVEPCTGRVGVVRKMFS